MFVNDYSAVKEDQADYHSPEEENCMYSTNL
jgi:hypothetical protein